PHAGLRAGVQDVARTAEARWANRHLALQRVQQLVQDERRISQGDAAHAAEVVAQIVLGRGSTVRRSSGAEEDSTGGPSGERGAGVHDPDGFSPRSNLANSRYV